MDIRFLTPEDIDACVEIDRFNLLCRKPWDVEDFRVRFRRRTPLIVVLADRDIVNAYATMFVRKDVIFMKRMYAHPDFGAVNAWSYFAPELVRTVRSGSRERVLMNIHERDVDVQLYLQRTFHFACTGTQEERDAAKRLTGDSILTFEYGLDLLGDVQEAIQRINGQQDVDRLMSQLL